MSNSHKLWPLIDHFMEVIETEAKLPVLIYDTKGYIIRATDKSRIGSQHAGAVRIMKGIVDECAITAERAANNPLVQEGYSCAIKRDGRIETGFGITGKLEVAKPLAKVAVKMLHSWMHNLDYQEQLERSERKYRNIFDHSLHGIYQTTMDGRLVTANEAFARIFGYTSPDDLMENVTNIAQQLYEDASDRTQLLKELLKHGHVSDFNVRFVHRNGQDIDGSIHARIKYDSDTDEPYIEGFIQDITENRKAEHEAARLEGALIQAQKMEAIGTLAGGIAHDFNNILSAVIGYSQLSLSDTPPHMPLHHNLEQILLAGMRAKELISQIMTFSRQQENERMPLQVAPLVVETLQLLRASLPATIHIVDQIDTYVDNVSADPTQIRRLIMNLCTNAAQAMDENGGQLTIRLAQVELKAAVVKHFPEQASGPHIKLSIEDTGTGIAADHIDRIFNPYFTTKEPDKGTGLGLSVVLGIVKSYNGAIDVQSTPGQGSTFVAYIPAIKHRPISEKNKSEPLPRGDECILLVDDESFVRDVTQQMLEKLGYEVTACRDGREALEHYQQALDTFDLVISDVTMPKMTGDVLATELLKIKPELPIILCTGFSEKLSKESVWDMGVKGFLLKPMVINELAHLIRKVLQKN